MKTRKLFISYRSSDAVKVDKIARDLALLRFEDNTTPRYIPWQDKHNLPPASPHWWDAIVDAIIDNEIFVFNVSLGSLKSEVCQAELDYAHKRNRPIIPVVLEDEFFLDPKSGKYNIDYWQLIPDWLAERQFLFYTGTGFYGEFQKAVELFERNFPRDIVVPRPLNTDSKGEQRTNHAKYDKACDYAGHLAFAEAKKLFDALVRRNDPDYGDVAADWLQLLYLYEELIEIDGLSNARFRFRQRWAAYKALFPKEFLDGIFDPKGFQAQYDSQAVSAVAAPVPAAPVKPAHPSSIDRLPAPFAWIDIPGTKGKNWSDAPYSIAKYPLTNAQFKVFIDAGGYREERWWTKAGWQQREKAGWAEPRYWTDKKWNGEEQPVVGVSWYEAVAFCLWLSATTGEKIMLPTEAQWQYAAQGDNGRDYPWGNGWDGTRCNNSVKPQKSSVTTPVRQYEGKGDSPFEVVDMAGNVWEWCLTDYENSTNDINSNTVYRVLRGGSWGNYNSALFRCVGRYWIFLFSGTTTSVFVLPALTNRKVR